MFFRLIVLESFIVTGPNFEDSVSDLIEDVMIEKNHKLDQKSADLSFLLELIDKFFSLFWLEELIGFHNLQ